MPGSQQPKYGIYFDLRLTGVIRFASSFLNRFTSFRRGNRNTEQNDAHRFEEVVDGDVGDAQASQNHAEASNSSESHFSGFRSSVASRHPTMDAASNAALGAPSSGARSARAPQLLGPHDTILDLPVGPRRVSPVPPSEASSALTSLSDLTRASSLQSDTTQVQDSSSFQSFASDVSVATPLKFRFLKLSVHGDPDFENYPTKCLKCRSISSIGPIRVDPNADIVIQAGLSGIALVEGDIYVHIQRNTEESPTGEDEISRWIWRRQEDGTWAWIVARGESSDVNSTSPIDNRYCIYWSIGGRLAWVLRRQAGNPSAEALRDTESWASEAPRRDLS